MTYSITEAEANRIVSAGLAEWDNWDLILYEDSDGFYNESGMFRKGKWINGSRIKLSNDGRWNIPRKFIAKFNKLGRFGQM